MPERVLLLVQQAVNRQLLARWLSAGFEVHESATLADEDEFDVIITDAVALDASADRLLALKRRHSPVFLPTLMLVQRGDVGMATRHLWKVIDEIVTVPINQLELQARLRQLLQTRALSLRLRDLGEARFEAVFERSAVGLGLVSRDGHLLRANPRLAELVDRDPGALAGAPWQDITHPDDRNAVSERGERLFAGDVSRFDLEVRLLRSDGSPRSVLLDVGRLDRDDGTLDFLVAAVRDIDERKRAEERVRKLALAVEQSPESIIITDARSEIEYVNGAFLRSTGYDASEVLGRNPRILSSGMTPRAVHDDLWATLLRGEVWRGEFHNRRRDGSLYVERAVITPLRDDRGTTTHYVAVKEDVTEFRRITAELDTYRQHLEEMVDRRTDQLEAARGRAEAYATTVSDALLVAESAEKAKSSFLATMSHELRTPLNSIIGFTDIILQGLVGPLNPEQARQLAIVKGSARHLLDLINDVLDISKIEAGKFEVRAEPVDLPAMIERVIASIKPLADQKGLTLTAVVSPALGEIVSDRLRVEQILLNMLSNAVKFTDFGGVTLTVDRVVGLQAASGGALRPSVCFRVADSGIGVRPDELATLFQPFQQAASGRSRAREGTGLGLAISLRLAKLLGGEISAVSELAKGSTFTFILPLLEQAETALERGC